MNAAVMGKDASATIQDTVDNLTTNFISLQIKKSRVAEVMSEEWNLIIKDISRHPLGTNKEESLQARVNWIDHWVKKNAIDYLNNCIFVDESGFDINRRRSRSWAKHGNPNRYHNNFS
ncbi:hypothetical protein F4703DRAFT_1927932 [Phycomyces blakesleeanus]